MGTHKNDMTQNMPHSCGEHEISHDKKQTDYDSSAHKHTDNHNHNHTGSHHHHAGANIAVAFWLNLSFTIIEFVGGVLTNSIAIMSDALHDLGDSLSLGLAWYFEKLSKKGRDRKYTFGYKRFSILGAIINSVILIVGSIVILYNVIGRINNPQPTNSQGMILLAILGVIVNGFAVFRLKKGESLNERAVYLHLLEDVLGWVAVLIGAIIMYYTHWYWIDPFLSILIAAFILFNVYRNIKSALNIILQATPEGIQIDDIKKRILEHPIIKNIHHIHVWTIDGQQHILTAHLVVDNINDYEHISSTIKKCKTNLISLGIQHCTFEIETMADSCNGECL